MDVKDGFYDQQNRIGMIFDDDNLKLDVDVCQTGAMITHKKRCTSWGAIVQRSLQEAK